MSGQRAKKREVSELALFGGEALFSPPLVVGRPNIPEVDDFVADVRAVLASGILSNTGPRAKRLEEEICETTGVEHCVVTCNATAALELTARALGLSGEVIVPAFTFIATPHALAWQGLKPVFVDVDPVSHTIDPACVEAAITESTTSICGVHLWGNPCDVDALQEIATDNDLELWYDASHAISVTHAGKQIGGFGRAEIFSFHATKFINAFEGGAIVTNDADLARKLREMRNFGFSEDREREAVHLGINAKMSELSAAMGLRSLEQLSTIRDINRRNFHRYEEGLSSCDDVTIVAPVDPASSNCQYVVLDVNHSDSGLSRDMLMDVLHAEGVLAKPYFSPGCHAVAPYRADHLRRGTELPITDLLVRDVLVLPTGPSVDPEKIDDVCGLIRLVAEDCVDIRCRRSGR